MALFFLLTYWDYIMLFQLFKFIFYVPLVAAVAVSTYILEIILKSLIGIIDILE